MTRVGYVGLDHHHCEPYLETLSHVDGAAVTDVCDPGGAVDPASVGLGDATEHAAVESLLDAGVDVAWVTLSNRETPAVLRAAVEAGVDVYTEKPAARTAADLEPVAERARDSGVTCCVSYPWRVHPAAADVREAVRDGFFGDLRAFEARFYASQVRHRDPDHYLFDPAASRGGVVQWLGVHWVDLLAEVLPAAFERANATLSSDHPGVDVEDGATVALETADGAHGTLNCGYYLRDGRYDTHLQVLGTEGRARWTPVEGDFGFGDDTAVEFEAATGRWGGTPVRTREYGYESVSGYGGGWGLEFVERFFAAREGDGEVPADLDDAVDALRVLDAVYESAGSDGWATVQ